MAARKRGIGFMRSTFSPRAYPEVIVLPGIEIGAAIPGGDGDLDTQAEYIVGPFCVHCGNPLSLHGEGLTDMRCPNRVLHPLLPNPSCSCHGLKAKA